MATQAEILKVWVMLLAAYPHFAKDATPETLDGTLEVYQRLLGDLPVKAIEAAALDHVSRCKWFPTIAEIREKAIVIKLPTQPTAMEAWGEVSKAILSIGSWSPQPRFTHPTIDKTVTAMGWVDLCRSEDGIADRARFIQAYDRFVQRQHDDALTLPKVREVAAQLRGEERKQLPEEVVA